MVTQIRGAAPGLIDQARAEPYRFGFFQLVRLLRLYYSRAGRMDPEIRPHDDPLRFRTLLSLGFPASEVHDLDFENPQRQSAWGEALTSIQVTFLGLVGPSGVLPRPYTEMLIDRHIQYRDDGAHAFMDMFSHRTTALFYEAWQKYRFHIEYERHGSADVETYLLNLLGFAPSQVKQLKTPTSGSVRRELFGFFSGMLSQRPRNRFNLEAILGFYFEVPCKVRPFCGQWLDVPQEQRTRLGGQHAQLGRSAMLGRRVWDYQSCVKIEVGPLDLEQFQRFMPDQPAYAEMTSLARLYLGVECDIAIELALGAEHIPAPRLGAQAGNVRLGWLGWLKNKTCASQQDGRATFKIFFDGATS